MGLSLIKVGFTRSGFPDAAAMAGAFSGILAYAIEHLDG